VAAPESGDDSATGHLFRVDVSADPFTAIGLPYEDTAAVFTDMHENRGLATGLRASIIEISTTLTPNVNHTTPGPTSVPTTKTPTAASTAPPTGVPTGVPTDAPSRAPTGLPTVSPTGSLGVHVVAQLTHAGWDIRTDSVSSTFVGKAVLAQLMTTCVPLTTRVELTAENLDDLTAANLVYRRAPIDCAMLSSNSNIIANPTVAALFHDGGICDGSSGSKLTWLELGGVTTGNSVAEVTNVRTTSSWYNIMADYGSTNNGYIFFNTELPLGNQQFPLPEVAGGTTNVDEAYTLSQLLPRRGPNAENLPGLGGVPSCAASGETSKCSVSIDRTSLVPCTTVGATNWPVCQKPTMWNLYPRYTPTDPTTSAGTFMYPVNLYKRGSPQDVYGDGWQTVIDHSSSWWSEAEWTSFTTMVSLATSCDPCRNNC
jgi:hypothetical protein